MVVFDVPFAFTAAALLEARAGGTRPIVPVAYAGLGVAVPGLAFLQRYPAWDWQYLLDPARLPPEMPAIFAGAVLLAGLAGQLLANRRPRAWLAGAAVLAVHQLISLPRTIRVADYATWVAGSAPLAPPSFLLYCAAWMLPSALALGLLLAFGRPVRIGRWT